MSNAHPIPELEAPGAAAARRGRAAIEDALLGLVAIPVTLERETLRERLLRAIQYTYAVQDSTVVAATHLDGLREAGAILGEVIGMVERSGDPAEVPPLRELCDRLQVARRELTVGADRVATIQLARRAELVGGDPDAVPPARPFRANRGVPELHAFARPPLLPWVNVGENPPPPARMVTETIERPSTLDDLRAIADATASGALAERLTAEAPAAPAAPDRIEALPPVYQPAVEEVELLRRLARDCLEDVANHRCLRKPNALEGWLDQEPFERRLLRNIDAFAALGGSVLPLVSLFHAEAKAPDPERAFAVALTLGCIEGSDTVGAAVMTLKQSAPEEHPGWIEGFWLAPNPAIDVAMADLCTSARPELVALALDVLHARGRTPDEVIVPLLDRPEPAIATRIARALATALPRHDAIDRLERICDTTEDDDIFLAAIESLLRRGHGPAVDLLRDTIDAPTSGARARRALPLLCVVGRASDLDRLLAAANEAPTVRLLRGLGRFGHVEALGTLINFLEHEDADVVAAAAEALDRITGAGLRETVEEPWEVELPPEAADAGGIPVPMRKVERIVTDSAQWSAWMRDKARRFDAKAKTRGGVPFTPMQIVAELEAKSTPPDRREEASHELALVTGIASSFSPHDWVARQKKHLAELRAEVSAIAASPGAWPIAVRRHVAEEAPPAARRPPSIRPEPEPAQLGEAAPALLPPLADQPEMRWARWAGPHDVVRTEDVDVAAIQAALPFKKRPPEPTFSAALAAAPPQPPPDEAGHETMLMPAVVDEKTDQRPADTEDVNVAAIQAALPFAVKPSPSKALSTTMAVDISAFRLPVLPFDTPASSEPSAPAAPSSHAAAPSLSKTTAVQISPFHQPVLPFSAPASSEPAGISSPPPPAPTTRTTETTESPPITIEQYASLCVELSAAPAKATEIMRRYGLTPEQATAVDAYWKSRVGAEPVTRAAFDRAYAAYKAWFTAPR